MTPWPSPHTGWTWLGQLIIQDDHGQLLGVTGDQPDIHMTQHDHRTNLSPLDPAAAYQPPPSRTLEVGPITIPRGALPERGQRCHLIACTIAGPALRVHGHGTAVDWIATTGPDRPTMYDLTATLADYTAEIAIAAS